MCNSLTIITHREAAPPSEQLAMTMPKRESLAPAQSTVLPSREIPKRATLRVSMSRSVSK